jgi:hypothetical protein
MKFGTEIMGELFTKQAVVFFFGRADVLEHSIQKPGNHPKERNNIHNTANIPKRDYKQVCVKNIIRNLFLHFGLNVKSKSRYCCEYILYFILQGHCPSLLADR